jgi:c(7)-type cytochrome triheme protein
MKFARLLTLGLAAAFVVGSAFAVPKGKTVEFKGSDAGKVVFDGKAHADAGLKCNDCHKSPKLFEKEAGADEITMKAINAGKFCGACHSEKGGHEKKGKAFMSEDKANCNKCHKK